jgi:hypothetical protein
MKNLLTTVALLFIGITTSFSQTESEKDSESNFNDNFSLEGALAIFKQANTLEEFEKLINTENNSVNNLDLNNDGNIDYISVNSIKDNDTHVIVLQTWINETEKQDIATIGIEKTGEAEAQLQIIGDEEIFGENAIAEPFDSIETLEQGKGPNSPNISIARVVVNVWLWPCVRFVYAPNYVVYTSPFRWRMYPNWWKPWRPVKVVVFRSRVIVHKSHYHKTTTFRVVKAKKIYAPRRSHSTVIVKNRRGTTVIHKGKRGRTTVVKRNRRR